MYYQTIKGTHATERHVNRKKVATILLQYNNNKKSYLSFVFLFKDALLSLNYPRWK